MHSPIYYLTETLDFSRENLKRNMPYDELFYDTIEETDYFDFHNSDNNESYRRERDSPLELFKNDELFIVEEHNKDFVKVIVTKENWYVNSILDSLYRVLSYTPSVSYNLAHHVV